MERLHSAHDALQDFLNNKLSELNINIAIAEVDEIESLLHSQSARFIKAPFDRLNVSESETFRKLIADVLLLRDGFDLCEYVSS
ncbi:hypothetical protein [Alteromonas facilis]|uniref:hypothetical protein n=1 Tax=Alteromonas facilis TaxID=2048004 RepID=UPI000C2893DE|nr:hypothetical protein [Alteromonas facilis]